jgi:hypothetical protein
VLHQSEESDALTADATVTAAGEVLFFIYVCTQLLLDCVGWYLAGTLVKMLYPSSGSRLQQTIESTGKQLAAPCAQCLYLRYVFGMPHGRL